MYSPFGKKKKSKLIFLSVFNYKENIDDKIPLESVKLIKEGFFYE